MTEYDRIARRALDEARAGRPDESLTLLERLHGVDPKPVLFWYALSHARLRKGEHELAYNCLSAFQAKLHSKHMELIGLTRPGAIDPRLLIEINGPLEIVNLRQEANAYRARNDFAQASECMGKVVVWRIDKLKELGVDIFAQ